jgi:mono/diheme cytochrome c family protein
MRTVMLTLLAVAVLAIAGASTFIYAGAYDVSATRPHWPLTYWAMETVRVQSVKAQASGITPPPNWNDHVKVVDGTEHYAAHCASCHGAPGVPRGDIAKGLYPQPANLARSAQRYTSGEMFWILKNGIKMSGMPAWSDHSDDELWGTVAFLEKLPSMSEADYGKLIMESMKQGGRHNHDDAMPGMDHGAMPGMDHGSMPSMSAAPDKSPAPDDQKHRSKY